MLVEVKLAELPNYSEDNCQCVFVLEWEKFRKHSIGYRSKFSTDRIKKVSFGNVPI